MDHFPVKLLPRESQDFMTWGCEGCTEIFATKNEFNKHVVLELKKILSPDSTSQDEEITPPDKLISRLIEAAKKQEQLHHGLYRDPCECDLCLAIRAIV